MNMTDPRNKEGYRYKITGPTLLARNTTMVLVWLVGAIALSWFIRSGWLLLAWLAWIPVGGIIAAIFGILAQFLMNQLRGGQDVKVLDQNGNPVN